MNARLVGTVQAWVLPAARGLALALPILASLLYWNAIRPAQLRLEQARQQETRLRVARQAGHPVPPVQAELARFYARFRADDRFPDALEQLVGMAKGYGLRLNEGDYKVSREMAGKLVRYQIMLPLRGEYPQVRQFLAELAQAWPALALENAQFERPKLGDSVLDVKLRLVLFLGRAR